MNRYYLTPEEHAKVALEALEETYKKNMASKEEARAFLKRAGIILEDAPETKVISKTNKSK